MEALIVLTLSFGLLWLLYLLPQQRRVRAHQQLVASLEEGDEVVLSAGIFGRITWLGPEEIGVEVAPGVELRVARQAVLRRVELAVPSASASASAPAPSSASTDEAG
jgi:preprotein translocase subunit YajC